MATDNQKLGARGETLVAKHCGCPRCKKPSTLRRLRTNFKCADLICDFCGYLAQVKASSVNDVSTLPTTVQGATWSSQKERMDAGIYFPLFLVLIRSFRDYAIYYLPADLQPPEMFKRRKPLRATAKRSGWQGFYYDLKAVKSCGIVRLR